MLILFLIILGAIATTLYFLYSSYKNKARRCINAHQSVYVKGATQRYANLPFGGYGIPKSLNLSSGKPRVRIIFPRLTEEGDVEYIYSWHDLWSVKFPSAQTLSNLGLQAKLAAEIAPVIWEHLQVDEEIARLIPQYNQVNQLADLVSSSAVYHGQSGIYERALSQLQSLLNRAEDLQNIYVRLIREAMIGSQVAQFNPDMLTDRAIDFEGQYGRLKQEFEQMKDEATAYAELMRSKLD